MFIGQQKQIPQDVITLLTLLGIEEADVHSFTPSEHLLEFLPLATNGVRALIEDDCSVLSPLETVVKQLVLGLNTDVEGEFGRIYRNEALKVSEGYVQGIDCPARLDHCARSQVAYVLLSRNSYPTLLQDAIRSGLAIHSHALALN